MEALVGMMCDKTRNTKSHRKLQDARGRFLLEFLKGAQLCRHLDFGFLASRTVRE